jgi:hypothetical protein
MIMQKELHKWEWGLMLAGIPLFLFAWFLGNQVYDRPFSVLVIRQFGGVLLVVLLQWFLIVTVLRYFRRRYPQYQQTFRRLILSILISGLGGMVLSTLVLDLPGWLSRKTSWETARMMAHFGPMFFFSALVVGAHEALYNFFEIRRINQEREELKRAHLQIQLDSVKNEESPHFLFNSLHTLLSLIPDSAPRAEQFVQELSSVCRYLLLSSERQLATLSQELSFAHSYFHLLQTRFGQALQMDCSIEQELEEYQLPSLTLQLLLENAVKHNVASTIQPLEINIFTQRENGKAYLSVVNNLQRKQQLPHSTRMGLNNILSKFKLLDREDITILEDGSTFQVTVPLIKKIKYAGVVH